MTTTSAAPAPGPDADIDRNGPMPLYHQVYTTLREEILGGAYDPDGILPSEQDLETRFAVSRITVRRAVAELERRGIVTRSQGRPTRINPRARHRPLASSMDSALADTFALGLETEVHLLDYETVPAPEAVATVLGVPAGTPVLWVNRLRLRDGEPFCHVELYLPPWVVPHVTREAVRQDMMVAILQKAGFQLDHGEQTLVACAADARLAALLDIPEGAPVLELERVVRDPDDRVVEYVRVAFRGNRFRYRMVLGPEHYEAEGRLLAQAQAPRVEP